MTINQGATSQFIPLHPTLIRTKTVKTKNILLMTALLLFLVAPGAIAQVTPGAWYFEIDGDYGSVLGPWEVPGDDYTLQSRNITDGEGVDRHTTFAPREGYQIGVDEPACSLWYHISDTTYMGAQAYRVQAMFPGRHNPEVEDGEEPRRSEQMLLNQWYPGTDGARYFTLAFRFNTLGPLPATTSGFIAQWHQGGGGPPPVRLSWAYADGTYSLSACMYKDSATNRRIWESFHDEPALPDVWHYMLFSVDLGPAWGELGCEGCPGDQGSVSAWMMNPQTGLWEPWGKGYQGQIGYRYKWEDESPPRRYRTGKELAFQFKVGHYASETDWVSLDYDNVAYGKRWNAITKNKLIGYKKSVLNLQFDEGSGTVANDTCWSWNGGQQGDATMDYDNDGSLQGNVGRSTDGMGFYRRSLYFNGGFVNVPLDTTDFDFGNYVTVSAWFNTTATAPQLQGLVSIDEDDGVGKLFLARADGRLTFGVRHPDGTYSQVIYNHTPGLYADGRWHHLVGTFNRFIDDNRRVKLYVDGQRLLQREGYDKPILRGDTRLVVGRIGSSGGFIGNIDEVNILNYTMTDAEVAALMAQAVSPATRIWDGGSPSTGTWTADANWQGNVRPATGDLLIFPAGAARLANTNTFSADKVFGGILFQGDGYHIYGNAVTITNHITAESGASGNVFWPDIQLGAPTYFRAQGSGLQLTLLGDINLNEHDLTFSPQGELDCAGVISGTGKVSESGPGRVVFSGVSANTYTGDTDVYDGILVLSKYRTLLPSGARLPRIAIPGNLRIGLNNSSLISDAVVCDMFGQFNTNAQVTVNATGELNLNGYGETILFLRLAGGHVTTGSGQLTVRGNIVCDPDADGSVISGQLDLGDTSTCVTVEENATLFVPASISGGPSVRLTKQGLGELRLNSSNSYAGYTVIEEGTLRVAANDSLGSGTNGVSVTGGRLILANATATGKTLMLGSTLAAEGSLSTWNGDVMLETTPIMDTVGSATLALSGTISGSTAFRKIGSGTLRLIGDTANTFTGGCAVHAGMLELGKFHSSAETLAIAGPLSVGDGVGGQGADIVRYGGNDQIADNAPVLVADSGRLELQGWSDKIGSLSGDGEVALGTGTLTVGDNGPPTTFAGLLSGAGNLVKSGAATLRLLGTNTYSGTTTVAEGVLLVNGYLAASPPVVVQAGATLGGTGRMQGFSVSPGGRVAPGEGPGTLTAGAVQLSQGTLEIELDGLMPGMGYDQLTASGPITLGGKLEVIAHFLPQTNDTFLILNNTGATPVSGTFEGLVEGAAVLSGGFLYGISYTGGDGNDVVLTALQAVPPPALAITRGASSTIVISWPLPTEGWVLEWTNVLPQVSAPWPQIAPPYQTNGVKLQFTEPAPSSNKFYRLRKPS